MERPLDTPFLLVKSPNVMLDTSNGLVAFLEANQLNSKFLNRRAVRALQELNGVLLEMSSSSLQMSAEELVGTWS